MAIQPPEKLVTPLSAYRTTESVVTEIRSRIDELDNTNIQNYEIRAFLNTAVSQMSELLRLAGKPDYGFSWNAFIPADASSNGLYDIDLSIPVGQITQVNLGQRPYPSQLGANPGTFTPITMIATIDQVTGWKHKASQALLDNVFTGVIPNKPYANLVAYANNMNTSHRQSIYWDWHGEHIWIFIGKQISPDGTTAEALDLPYNAPINFTVWGTRLPLLDMLDSENAPLSTYKSNIDVPDRFVRLVILMAEKACLEKIGKPIDPSITSEIIAITQPLNAQQQQANNDKGPNSGPDNPRSGTMVRR